MNENGYKPPEELVALLSKESTEFLEKDVELSGVEINSETVGNALLSMLETADTFQGLEEFVMTLKVNPKFMAGL